MLGASYDAPIPSAKYKFAITYIGVVSITWIET